MTPLLSARGLRKLFPLRRAPLSREKQRYVHAVDGVDLEIAVNETVALVGESGSGKTTLGMLVLGLHEPTSGVIQWNGRTMADLSREERQQFRREVQVVFQDPYGSLNPRLSVRRIIGRPLRLHEIVPRGEIEAEVLRLLDRVGLRPAETFAERFPHEFSGGQRQRIAIARALGLRPRLIVADEPVSALDVSVRAQVLSLLGELRREYGISMLFTTHDLGVVRHVADRVAVMYLGKIVEIAGADSFFRAARHPYSRMLLASALSPNPEAGLGVPAIEVAGEPPSPVDPPSGCRFRTRCPHASERCTTEEPALRERAPGHRAACHLDEVS